MQDATVSLAEVVGDLLSLTELAAHEDEPERRRSLHAVRTHLAARDQGAKVSEAAEVLEISQPTVRAWLDGGILAAVAGTKPLRVGVLSLAEVKRSLNLIRLHADDRQLLAQVMRVLRDREALAGSEEGSAGLRAGRVVPLGDDLRSEIDQLQQRGDKRSKSG